MPLKGFSNNLTNKKVIKLLGTYLNIAYFSHDAPRSFISQAVMDQIGSEFAQGLVLVFQGRFQSAYSYCARVT